MAAKPYADASPTADSGRPVLGLLATNVRMPRSPTDVAGLKEDNLSLFQGGNFISGSLLASSATTFESLPEEVASPSTTLDSLPELKPTAQPEMAWEHVDVILAEDEPIYVDIVKKCLAERGILAEGILAAEDGLKAMELLLASQSGSEARPLLLLLDVRMPHMDGRECATRAREMADRGMFRRPPFIVGYSADTSSVPMDEGLWPFDALLSKEAFSPKSGISEDGALSTCLQAFQQWWEKQPYGDSKRWRLFDLEKTDCVIADDWPICRMNVTVALSRLGMHESHIHEADNGDEALEQVSELVTANDTPPNPLLVILDQQMPEMTGSQCASKVRDLVSSCTGGSKREPFLVCISASDASTSFSQDDKEVFHCFLPKSFTPDDLRWVLELFRLWWLEKYAPIQGKSPVRKTRVPCKRWKEGAEDLNVAMQAWRERRDRRRRKQQEPHVQEHPPSYGDQIRRRAATRRLTPEELNAVLQEEWPGEYLPCADDPIGQGSQADVYKRTWRMPGSLEECQVAIKVGNNVAALGADGLHEFDREREIGRAFRSIHLVEILASSTKVPSVLIQEFCSGGSLHDFLHNENSAQGHSAAGYPTSNAQEEAVELPTMKQRLKIALDVARGMQCLHGANPPVMHRDLKSANVLLFAPVKNSTDVPLAKVSDFGLARTVPGSTSKDRYVTQSAGSLRWMAPEVMCSDSYDNRADVFSYGSLLFELLTSTFPYGEKPCFPQTLEGFLAEGGRPDMLASGIVSDRLYRAPSWVLSVMREAWSQDPNDRPTFAAIVSKFEENWALQ